MLLAYKANAFHNVIGNCPLWFKCQQSQLEPHWWATLMSHVSSGQTDTKRLLSGGSSASGGLVHAVTAASRYLWLPPSLRPAMSAARWPSTASRSPCAGRWPVSRRDTRHMLSLVRVNSQSHAGGYFLLEEGRKETTIWCTCFSRVWILSSWRASVSRS